MLLKSQNEVEVVLRTFLFSRVSLGDVMACT